MTLCSPALSTQSLPTCIEVLTIGTIPDLNQAVNVIIEDITTGRKEMFSSTSSGAGLVTVDLTGIQFSESHVYQMWIYKTTNNIDERYAVTVSGTSDTAELIGLNFEAIQDDGVTLSVATATVKAA